MDGAHCAALIFAIKESAELFYNLHNYKTVILTHYYKSRSLLVRCVKTCKVNCHYRSNSLGLIINCLFFSNFNVLFIFIFYFFKS